MDSASVVVVDDSSGNPDLVFDGEWTHLFGISSAANGTLTYTPASSSSVSFRFNGTSVGVSGAMVPLNGTAATTSVYSVDGEHTATLTSFDNITVTTYGVTFYLAQALSAGEHTLVINVTHTTGNTPYLLDYIGYIPLPSVPVTSQPVGQTGSPAPSHSSKSSVPVGPIVGGVIGGVFVLVVLAMGLWWLYFRRSESEEEFNYPDISAAEIIHQEPKPPTFDATPVLSDSPVVQPNPLPLSTAAAQLPAIQERMIDDPHSSPPELPVLAPNRLVTSHSPAANQSSLHHEDSGLRFMRPTQPTGTRAKADDESDISDVPPPMYTER